MSAIYSKTPVILAALGVVGLWVAKQFIREEKPAEPAPVNEPVAEDTKPSPRTVKAIFFDMDGTLLETVDIWFELLRQATIQFGYPELQYDDYLTTFGQSMQKNVDRFLPGFDKDTLDKFCFDNYEAHIDKMHMLAGAEEAVELANALTGNKTYLVTNCPYEATKIILASPKAARLRALFTNPDGTLRAICADDIITGVEGPVKLAPKPDPAMLLEAAARVNVSPRESILVGDSIYDILTANNAGAGSVGIKKDADCVIDTIADFAAVKDAFKFMH